MAIAPTNQWKKYFVCLALIIWTQNDDHSNESSYILDFYVSFNRRVWLTVSSFRRRQAGNNTTRIINMIVKDFFSALPFLSVSGHTFNPSETCERRKKKIYRKTKKCAQCATYSCRILLYVMYRSSPFHLHPTHVIEGLNDDISYTILGSISVHSLSNYYYFICQSADPEQQLYSRCVPEWFMDEFSICSCIIQEIFIKP